MMVSLKLKALEDHLKLLKYEPQLQQETNQLIVVYKVGGVDFPLFFRIFEGGELLQMITFIPCNVKASAVSDLARILHLLNKEVDLPGFGMDEKAGIVYYRFMLPALRGQVEGEILETVIDTIKKISETFANVIAAVAVGAASFDDVMKKANESK
ncbi:MAG: YbjN domain-containing protein [Parachlamydia sp.]|nr:YbjN domain-containing protein [Parachlamydia sp.]